MRRDDAFMILLFGFLIPAAVIVPVLLVSHFFGEVGVALFTGAAAFALIGGLVWVIVSMMKAFAKGLAN